MTHPIHRIVLLALLLPCFVSLPRVASADDFEDTKSKIGAALAADDRPEKNVLRDKNRKPVETLEFFGLRDDMKVVELLPGGGWYTRVLAPVLRENGEFWVAYGTGTIEDTLLKTDGFDQVKVTARDAKIYRPKDARRYVIENSDLGIRNADLVLTFRNYHNFDAAGRKEMNDAAFEALRKGGIYGIVDHTRRHMEDDSSENGRRFDPVKAIAEIQSAGFELLDFSALHFRADDELRYEVGRKTVTGNTDRWTLKFKKVRK